MQAIGRQHRSKIIQYGPIEDKEHLGNKESPGKLARSKYIGDLIGARQQQCHDVCVLHDIVYTWYPSNLKQVIARLHESASIYKNKHACT